MKKLRSNGNQKVNKPVSRKWKAGEGCRATRDGPTVDKDREDWHRDLLCSALPCHNRRKKRNERVAAGEGELGFMVDDSLDEAGPESMIIVMEENGPAQQS